MAQELSTDTLSYEKNESMTIKEQLIDMICNNPNLPTLGGSITCIVQISSSVDESTQELANLILLDVSLTQKILRLSNSATFRSSSSQDVTNISKAIQLLGLDTVKACTLAMILVNGMPQSHAESVRIELALSLSASLIGRNLAKRSAFPNAEEVAIAALFKNMGRLLVAAFDDALYRKTMKLVKDGTHTHAQASWETIGCTFDELTKMAMKEWSIPDSIVKAMQLMPSKKLAAPKNRQEWMQQVTEFSDTAACLALQTDQATDDSLTEDLLNRFGTTLNLGETQLESIITDAAKETRELSNNAQLELPPNKKNNPEDDLFDGLLFDTEDADSAHLSKPHPSGKPRNSLDQLLTGVESLTKMVASKECKINELMLQVLETLYGSMGFHFATICLKDIKTNQYKARYSLGKNSATIQKNFIFPDTSSDNLFSLAFQKNLDLSISDATDQKICGSLPRWHRQLLPQTKSFIILPLIIKGKPIGLFYADRQKKAPEGISSDEMKLIKTLKWFILSKLS